MMLQHSTARVSKRMAYIGCPISPVSKEKALAKHTLKIYSPQLPAQIDTILHTASRTV
jgi:hypothetical protein